MWEENSSYPIKDPGQRKAYVDDDCCPECGSNLDTGFECVNRRCKYDAYDEALSELDKKRLGFKRFDRKKHG